MEVRERHFGRWNQHQVLVGKPEKIILEFGKLASAGHAGSVHDIGRQHFLVPMLGGV